MENVNELFDTETQGSGDLDIDIAQASETLSKLAAEEGVDLNLLSDTEVAEVLQELLPRNSTEKIAQTTTGEPGKKEAAMSDAPSLTAADVSLELQKVAAANDIDLTKLSKEEFTEVFDAMASEMSSPEYGSHKEAAEKQAAEAYETGVHMADGFLARLKQAEEESTEEEEAEKKRKEHEKEASAAVAAAGVRDAVKALKDEAVEAAMHRGGKAKDFLLRHRGKAEILGGTAALGTGAAGHAMLSHKKEAVDRLATKRAAEILVENGFDPETGNKLASDEEVETAAWGLLAQAGYVAK